MRLPIYIFILLCFNSFQVLGQIYTGPIPKPESGYGADGPHEVAVEAFTNPNFPSEDIRIYHPADITSPVPTLFYSHGFGGYNPANVIGLMNFVAKKGYAIVFVPYQTNGVTTPKRYHNLLQGFIKAAHDYPNIIDTTRVGFMGHSFGGGALFANAYYCFTQLNWGVSGRLIFASAQWYSYNISQDNLKSFPDNTKMLTMVYDDDSTNDHRMAIDIFNTINIPASEKDYLLVRSDTIEGYDYQAIHGVPNTASAFNALDYYAIYRHLDALCDYTFNGNLNGKEVALGNGSVRQISMPGGMKNLVQSDSPTTNYPGDKYNYPCDNNVNPRHDYCNDFLAVNEHFSMIPFSIFPNPALDFINITSDKPIKQANIISPMGQVLKTVYSNHIVINELPAGIYFISVMFPDESYRASTLIKI